MVFDVEPKMLVPLHISSAPGEALGELDSIRPGGGTRLAPALRAAVKELGGAQASQRMLVLVTDGFLPDGSISALDTKNVGEGYRFRCPGHRCGRRSPPPGTSRRKQPWVRDAA